MEKKMTGFLYQAPCKAACHLRQGQHRTSDRCHGRLGVPGDVLVFCRRQKDAVGVVEKEYSYAFHGKKGLSVATLLRQTSATQSSTFLSAVLDLLAGYPVSYERRTKKPTYLTPA